jgi:peptidoglycan/LPS O-acetylase OafA/YrhL
MKTAGDAEAGAPVWLARGRIPGLDALRAMSITLVIAAHALFASGHGFAPLSFGFLGVDVFFVISGFLITLLLLRERQRTGRVSLRDFYRRRALRIFPAYMVFLAAIAGAAWLGWERTRPGDWAAALTYTMDFRTDPAWSLGHVWSLSVEEQFYLLWPPLILLLSPKAAGRLLLGCIAAAPAFRVAARFLCPHFEALGRMSFPARLEPIAAGCLLALLATDPRGRAWLNRWLGNPGSMALALLALLGTSFLASRSSAFGLVCRSTLCALLIPAIIWGCANARAGSILGRVLAWPPLVGIGILSYSLYLWQQPFFDGAKSTVFVCRFPANIGLVVIAAVASYFLVERPFLQLKDRRPRRTPAVAQEAMASAV